VESDKNDILIAHRNSSEQKGSVDTYITQLKTELSKFVEFKQRLNVNLCATSEPVDLQTLESKVQ